MKNLETSLSRLALTFNARDIMVPLEELTYAKSHDEARKLLDEHTEFDVIPIMGGSGLTSYLKRDLEKPVKILVKDVVSESARILDLIDILKDRKFCFVLVNNKISGYIHFSDLNRSIVKLPFFLLLEALETHIMNDIKTDVDEKLMEEILGAERACQVKIRMEKQKKEHSDLTWINHLSFNEVLRISEHLGRIRLKPKEIEALSKVRNLTCHADKPFVTAHRDIKRLSDCRRICFTLL